MSSLNFKLQSMVQTKTIFDNFFTVISKSGTVDKTNPTALMGLACGPIVRSLYSFFMK